MAQKKPKSTKDTAAPDALHIGIDLGTSRSAVAASNGKKTWVQSYVGWPRDFVARKLLGREILFGEDAVEHRMSLELVRPLEAGVLREGRSRDAEAVRQLIHHLIEEVGPKQGQRIEAAVGVPAGALRVNKIAIREAVREHADALMVVSEPFAVAYGQNALDGAMVIDVGAGTADFCVMHGTMPTEEDQRTITLAGDYIDQQFLGLLEEGYPEARVSPTAARLFKEQHGYVGKPNGRLTMKAAVGARTTEIDATEALGRACQSILPGIVETALDLLARYEPEFQEVVRRNIYLAGGSSQIKGFAEALEERLAEYGPARVSLVSDPLFAGALGALALAQDMPEEYWESM